MKIAIFGMGYVGTTAAGCLANRGHSVIGIETNPAKVATLNQGQSPIDEPGLAAMIAAARAANTLSAVATLTDELDDCDLAMVCVGTPSGVDGAHAMDAIMNVTHMIAAAINPARRAAKGKGILTLAYRSTMAPGSCENLIWPIIAAHLGDQAGEMVELVYHPEFMREGSAIEDFHHPAKIVIGTPDARHSAQLAILNEGIQAPTFEVGLREAEMTKFVDNSWHAVKVAFANEIGRVCQHLGVSARTVHAIFTSDTKLNLSACYMRPGGAFGGSCLPKDVRALQYIAGDVGASIHLIDSLIRSNEAHKHHQFLHATRGLAPGARVLLVGLAFKPDTDDLRESPAVDMARKLLAEGYSLDIHDPKIAPERLIGQNLGYAAALLPQLDALLVSREEAEARSYDRIIATNRLVDTLQIDRAKLVDISVID